jgi:regulatory protein
MAFSNKQGNKPARKPKREREPGEEIERATKEPKKWNAMNYVVWLLGRREYSRAELSTKLHIKFAEKGLPAEDVEAVLERAQELGLQSNERFLESSVRMQKGAGKGPAFIRAKLRQHDLSESSIEQALSPDGNDWLAKGFDLAERKFGEGPYQMPLRNKVFNTLLRRGFSFDVSKKVVSMTRAEALEHEESR